MNKLHQLASELYDREATNEEWLKEFSLSELAQLWYTQCIYTDSGVTVASYDDEVYNALDSYNFWNIGKVK